MRVSASVCLVCVSQWGSHGAASVVSQSPYSARQGPCDSGTLNSLRMPRVGAHLDCYCKQRQKKQKWPPCERSHIPAHFTQSVDPTPGDLLCKKLSRSYKKQHIKPSVYGAPLCWTFYMFGKDSETLCWIWTAVCVVTPMCLWRRFSFAEVIIVLKFKLRQLDCFLFFFSVCWRRFMQKPSSVGKWNWELM